MLEANLTDPLPLQIQVADGRTDLYARAKIYYDNGTDLISYNLPHLSEGLYIGSHLFVAEGYYFVHYQVFEDPGYTISAGYDIWSETIRVTEAATGAATSGEVAAVLSAVQDVQIDLLKVLGLLHDNAVFDNQTYDTSGNLTSGRVRSYDSKSNAELAGATGLVHTWTITAEYTSGTLSKYQVVREP